MIICLFDMTILLHHFQRTCANGTPRHSLGPYFLVLFDGGPHENDDPGFVIFALAMFECQMSDANSGGEGDSAFWSHQV